MNKIIKLMLGSLVAVILIVSIWVTHGLSDGKSIEFKSLDLSEIIDGRYLGTYSNGRFSNEVEVEVRNNQIVDVKVKKSVVGGNEKFVAELIQSIVEKQSLNVDVVSGATVTTKAYLKSIENALNNQ